MPVFCTRSGQDAQDLLFEVTNSPKPSPFGGPNLTPVLLRVRLTPILERFRYDDMRTNYWRRDSCKVFSY